MSEPRIGQSDICAIFVTYFPTAESARAIELIAPQVDKILIVDNGSSQESFQNIESALERVSATIIRNGKNLGIAAALNLGLQFAQQGKYKWLLTMDQDSVPTSSMVDEMLAIQQIYSESKKIGLITPIHTNSATSTRYDSRHSLAKSDNWRLLSTAMTSGNLVSVNAASEIGGFDDKLFIDYVDHDFCLRLRRNGRHILEASKATLWHSLGNTTAHSILWRRPRTTNHSPLRRYYITRNRIYVWQQNWKFDPRWILRDIRSFFLESLFILFWESNKTSKLAAIMRGASDAIFRHPRHN